MDGQVQPDQHGVRQCGLNPGRPLENANRSRRAKAGPGFFPFVRPRPPVEIAWPPLLLPALDRDLGSVPFAGATSLLNVEPRSGRLFSGIGLVPSTDNDQPRRARLSVAPYDAEGKKMSFEI